MKNMLVGMFWVVASVAAAQNPHAVLDRYLTDDVMAVGYLDLSAVDTLGLLEWAEKLGFGPPPEERGVAVKKLLSLQKQMDELADEGVRYVYALFRVSDLSLGGPTWVIPAGNGSASRTALERIKAPFFPKHIEAVEGAVLGANSAEQLEQLKSKRANARRDLSAAWKALGNGHCGLLVFGDQDSRRVVREMFPKLPEPFEAIDGPLIADRLLWGGVVANFPPNPSLQIIIQTDENSSANVLQQAIAGSFALVKELPIAQQYLNAEDREALVTSLAPQVSDDRLVISFDDMQNDLDRLARMLTPPVKAARQAAWRTERMNKFKQFALAMHNYHDKHGTFPPRGTYSDDGKPLLSWRVHILPYLDQSELYKQFHLDEPWDSEHNKQLIPLMPAIYADPDSALQKRNAAGRTTYVVPTGKGTVFERPEGNTFKEITDGTSNTILLVEVASMGAPIWTQPKDWLVDLNNPWERLRQNDRDWFTAGFCDGHVRILSSSLSAKKLRALLTRDGGEVIEYP